MVRNPASRPLASTLAAAVVAPPHSADRGAAAGAATILVVEDDRPLRELLRLTLESCDYRVLAAADAAEALRLAEPPDPPIALLVSDVTLPGMSGPDLARRLAASRAGLKVLLLSGYSRADTLVGEETAFLEKPFRPRALAAKVREILGPAAGT